MLKKILSTLALSFILIPNGYTSDEKEKDWVQRFGDAVWNKAYEDAGKGNIIVDIAVAVNDWHENAKAEKIENDNRKEREVNDSKKKEK